MPIDVRAASRFTGLALALCLAWSAGAEHHEEMQAPRDAYGKYFWVDTATVVSVDPATGALTVADPDGQVTLLVDEATLIRKGSDTVALGDLDPGDRIAISAHEGLDRSDPPVADTVTVVIVDPDTGEPASRRK